LTHANQTFPYFTQTSGLKYHPFPVDCTLQDRRVVKS